MRDLKVALKDLHSCVFIDNFNKKHELNASFYFAYEVDVEDRLKCVVSTNSVSRKNYSLFGDVISFGTTYRTNK